MQSSFLQTCASQSTGMTRTPESGLPDLKNKDFSLTAQVYLPSDKENGVLATLGGKFGGFSFYFRQGYLVFHYNWVDQERYEVSSKEKIGAGEYLLQMRFKYDGLGRGKGKPLMCIYLCPRHTLECEWL